jgi:lipoprotein-anchoring transpeptidase ErfK/SrfK
VPESPTVQRLCAAVLALFLTGAAGAIPARKKNAKPRPVPTAKPTPVPLDAASVNASGMGHLVGPSAETRGPAVLRAQILLSRAHFSPGEIDGRVGLTMRKDISAFQKARGLPMTGVVSDDTWRALETDSAPAIIQAQIAPEDVAGPFTPVPEDMMEKAKLPALNYASALEGLGEKFHSSPALLKELNPGVTFEQAGATILVPNTIEPPAGRAARVVVSKSESSVAAYDAQGRILAWYPATIGSEHDPLPIGDWKIQGVSKNPEFHYNPDLFWDAKSEDRKALVPPGPNNPVGVAWIDLSKPHYGIHGTPEPSRIGKSESHGCIRLTNWDVWELQQMVAPGTPAILQE